MDRLELYINGILIDIDDPRNFGLRINKIVSDSNDLSKRGGLYTFTIKFPKSENNNRALKHSNEFKQTSKFQIKEENKSEIYINGANILNGSFLISRITTSNYEGVIYGQDISWINQMSGKNLTDIKSFPSKPFTCVAGNDSIFDYQNRVIAGTERDICFPFIGYGNYFYGGWVNGDPLDTVSNITFEELPPCVYHKAILKALYEDYGYNINGVLIDSETGVYKDYVLPFVGDSYVWNWGLLGGWNGQHTSEIINLPSVNDGQTTQVQIPFNFGKAFKYYYVSLKKFKRDYDYLNEGVDLPEFTVRKEGIYNFTLRYDNDSGGEIVFANPYVRNIQGNPYNVHARILVVKNFDNDLTTNQINELVSSPNTLANVKIAEQYGSPSTNAIYNGLQLIQVNDIDLEVGDKVSVLIVAGAQRDTILTIEEIIGVNLNTYRLDVEIQDHTDEIEPELSFPDISQLDFVKGFLNQFNQFFRFNFETNTITFVDKNVFYREPQLFVNLDEVCDINDFEILPILIPTKETFKWKEDKTDFFLNKSPNFANLELNNDNIYATGEILMQLPFAATRERSYNFTIGERVDVVCVAGNDELTTPLNEVEHNYSFEPRLLRILPFVGQDIRMYYNGLPIIFITAKFTNEMEWIFIYNQHYARKPLDKSNLIRGVAWINESQWRYLGDNYNVEIGGDRYNVEKIGAYDPQNRNPTELTLLKEV